MKTEKEGFPTFTRTKDLVETFASLKVLFDGLLVSPIYAMKLS